MVAYRFCAEVQSPHREHVDGGGGPDQQDGSKAVLGDLDQGGR